MNISIQTKVISLPILVGLILTAALLWPAHALADGPICSGPLLNLTIPDSPDRDVPGTPVTHSLTITDPTLIADLNIAITTTHTYVGDLIFTVTHKAGAVTTSTVIINRPLKGLSVLQHEVACSGDNIDVTLDDEALPDIQENCAEGVNEGDGTEAYNAGQLYQPFNPLSLFNGDAISGTWELTITDNYLLDEGTLDGWCLLPNQDGDLQIFKAAIPSHQVQGQPLTYTLSYTNSSNSQTATNVVITDIISMTLANVNFSNSGATITPTAGITYSWQVADLAPGEGGVITVTGTLSSGLMGGASFINTAIITATSTETNTANNQSDATVFIRRPDLQISKADGGLTVTPGDLITYTLAYANAQGTATGVVIVENLPANTSFNSGSPGWQQVGATSQYTYSVDTLTPGVSGVITFAVSVSNSLPSGVNTITNTAQISDDGNNGLDEDLEDNTSTQITPVVAAAPDLAITKTDGSITATAGSLITYTLTYTNKGGQDATGVVITETVPANTSFNSGSPGWQPVVATSQYTYNVGSLNVGPSQAITFVVAVDSPLPSGVDTITNTAQIGDGNNGTDPTPGDNTTIVTTPVITGPNLAITKTDGSITATAGSLITYTLTYTNKGGQNATGVVVTETVPANTSFNSGSFGWQQVGATSQYTYNVGSLSVGPSQTITFVVAVNNPLPGGVSAITNTVQIGDNGANGADQDLSDNQDEETTPTAITSQKVYLPLILRNN